MIIECLIKREGPTEIIINGFKYMFKKNDAGHYVAPVLSGEHRAWMLRDSQSFREYNPEKDYPGRDAPEKAEPVTKNDDSNSSAAFLKEWLHLSKNHFLEYLAKNIELFEVAPLGVQQSAAKKYKKCCPGNPVPFVMKVEYG